MRQLAVILLLSVMAVGQATKQLSITISPPPLAITTASLPGGTVGIAYSQTLTGTGGTPPYTWSVSSGFLPADLTLNASGLISGTPTSTGTSTFTIQLKDSTMASAKVDVQWNASITPGITGYNIWRDSLKISNVAGTIVKWSDTAVSSGIHSYEVTALVGTAESKKSNTATVVVP